MVSPKAGGASHRTSHISLFFCHPGKRTNAPWARERSAPPPRRCRSEYPPRMDPPPAATSPDSSSDASEDEALLEILGLSSLDALAGGDADDADADADAEPMPTMPVLRRGGGIPRRSASEVEATVRAYGLPMIYMHDQAVIFPGELAVPPGTMRRLADEVIWGGRDPAAAFCQPRRVGRGGAIAPTRP